MRILALIHDAYGAVGGTAKFNRDLLEALCSHPDVREVVALPRYITSTLEPMPQRLVYDCAASLGKIAFLRRTLHQLASGGRFDLIICGHLRLLPAAMLCRLIFRAPLILVIHGLEAWQPAGLWISDRLAGKADFFVAVSEHTKRRFVSWSSAQADRGFVVPNAVDLTQFQPKPPKAEFVQRYGLEGRRVILTLGRLASEERAKGFDGVLDVLPSLVREIPNLTYMIAGDGPDRARLQQKVETLGLDQHVVFAGFVPEAEKVDHFCLADAFVMPSYGEGFGIVLIEAMACGVPVVASKQDGSREAVKNGALGIVVDPDNPSDIQEGIREALQRPKGAVPAGLEYFSVSNFRRRWHRLLSDLCQSGETKTTDSELGQLE